MTKPLAIDLCCGVGGASMGLARAGYRVIGVDINPQPRYPFEFVQANALTFDISPADLVWASWPCQRWSKATPTLRQAQHPDLIEPGRQMLQQWGGPYVLENVTGAPLRTSIMLCGSMFGLNLFRHRNFESNFYLWQPPHPTWCKERVTMRRGGTVPTLAGRAGGKGGSTQTWREASGIPWAATARELAQAIPPSYSEYIGRQANAIGNAVNNSAAGKYLPRLLGGDDDNWAEWSNCQGKQGDQHCPHCRRHWKGNCRNCCYGGGYGEEQVLDAQLAHLGAAS